MPLNILQMISKNDKYGAQRVFIDQVAALHGAGHRVTVVTRGTEGHVSASIQMMGIPCQGMPMKGCGDIRLLRQLVVDKHIDIIHTSLDRADFFGLIVSKLTQTPLVSTMHVPRYHAGYRLADSVIVNSNSQKEILAAKGVKAGRIQVLRPGIDVHRFSTYDPEIRDKWQARLNTERYSMVFCHVASLIPRKEHVVSMQLVAECKKRGEQPLLVIIGDPLHGQYYDALLDIVSSLGIGNNVFFTGWTADIPEILSLSSITILPSYGEALGIVLMEGMAAGTPVVARRGEGGAELITEFGSGFLYDPDVGVTALADSILFLYRDSDAFLALSAKCRRIAKENFSLPTMGERIATVYASVLADRGR